MSEDQLLWPVAMAPQPSEKILSQRIHTHPRQQTTPWCLCCISYCQEHSVSPPGTEEDEEGPVEGHTWRRATMPARAYKGFTQLFEENCFDPHR